MPLAVTHVLGTIIILDLLRHYVFGKKKFPRYLLVVGGIAGLAPDIDIPLGWVYSFLSGQSANFHGLFTHSIMFVFLFALFATLLHYQKNEKWSKIFYVIAAGWFLHLVFDCAFGGYKTYVWPFSFLGNFCPQWGIKEYRISIDAIILVLWIAHEEIHKRIRDYI